MLVRLSKFKRRKSPVPLRSPTERQLRKSRLPPLIGQLSYLCLRVGYGHLRLRVDPTRLPYVPNPAAPIRLSRIPRTAPWLRPAGQVPSRLKAEQMYSPCPDRS